MDGLIVTRKPGDTIIVDGPATIRFIEHRGERARWQIIAPQSTKILRGEVLARIEAARAAESEQGGGDAE